MKGWISRLFYWYFSRRALPYWGIMLIDCLTVFFSALIILTVNSSLSYTVSHLGLMCGTILFYLIFYVIFFRVFRTYSGIIRYSSFVDLQRLGMAMTSGLLLSICVREIFNINNVLLPVRMRDMVLWTIMATLLMWMMRVLVKYLYDTLYKRHGAERIFIYGIKRGGISLAKSIRNQDPAEYILDGFVVDSDDMTNHMLMGVRVYKADLSLVDIMKNRNVHALFVSPLRSESLRENDELVNALIAAGIKIYMVPREQKWDGKSDISHSQLREVDIEDLLPRDEITVDMDAIGEQLRGKKIFISGAAGSIGSEIVTQVARFEPAELILIDQAETPLHDVRLMMRRDFPTVKAHTVVSDITDRSRMEKLFAEHRPDYAFHAAAYKHVPMMEDNPSESIRNNVEGTRILADMAVKYGTRKFVMISTDKAVNPTNVMGASKRMCEIYVQSLDKAIKDGRIEGVTQFVTTRFGNVLGSNGSVIPLFKEQIRNGGPITVTHPDIIRFFMLIPEACKLVLEAGTMGHGGEIFVFDMGQPVKIVDLARRMIQLSGANIDIKFTGLRDGEKLYEEVLNEQETTLPTFHPKIKIATVRLYDYMAINDALDNLMNSLNTMTDMEIVACMKQMVPEFHSQHSIYEQLDKK